MSLEVLNPVRTLQLRGKEWTVKELNWRDGMEFLTKLSASAGTLIETAQGADGRQKISFDFNKLGPAIAGTKQLTDFLLTKSTGKKIEEVEELTCVEVLDLLDAAIELNLSPQLVTRGKKVAGRVGAAFGVAGLSPAAPTPTSETPSIS